MNKKPQATATAVNNSYQVTNINNITNDTLIIFTHPTNTFKEDFLNHYEAKLNSEKTPYYIVDLATQKTTGTIKEKLKLSKNVSFVGHGAITVCKGFLDKNPPFIGYEDVKKAYNSQEIVYTVIEYGINIQKLQTLSLLGCSTGVAVMQHSSRNGANLSVVPEGTVATQGMIVIPSLASQVAQLLPENVNVIGTKGMTMICKSKNNDLSFVTVDPTHTFLDEKKTENVRRTATEICLRGSKPDDNLGYKKDADALSFFRGRIVEPETRYEFEY